jgi:hypothetical protein
MFTPEMSRKIAEALPTVRDPRLRARARQEAMREELKPGSDVKNLSRSVRAALHV